MNQQLRYYGLVNQAHALDMAQVICDVLGHGANGRAVQLMLETAAQETRLGFYRDPTPYRAGTGLCQIDEIAFHDIVARTNPRSRNLIREAFGIELGRLKYQELEFNPFLSLLFCRLHYLLVPAAIPVTLEDRAHYWKKYYNTVAGKGTPEEYVENAQLVADMFGSTEKGAL